VRGATHEVRARVVINATGAWADDLRAPLGHPPRIRRLRGSHLIFPRDRLPLDRAVGITSPADRRNMYVLPWEGVTLLGTTDLDHDLPLDREPHISGREGAYLLETVNHWFPDAGLTESDVIATQAGVRPVIGTGKKDPSKESREESVLAERRLVTISGGKLTTFPMMAEKALRAARRWVDVEPESKPAELPPREPDAVDDPARLRLAGRHGADLDDLLALGPAEPVEETAFVWPELRWSARHEQVVHLDDLMLRRTRLGLLLPEGGAAILERVGEAVRQDLGWDDARWAREVEAYRRLWREACSPELIGRGGD
jgi:glycerol-3-phosphate dehydrogenase